MIVCGSSTTSIAGDRPYFTVSSADSDNDGLLDAIENSVACLDGNDADTDDDGIPDGMEDENQDGIVDATETNPCNPDTDGDGIWDGTEIGLTSDDISPDTDTGIFIPDLNPTTTSDPTLSDSDADGLPDGAEDFNRNGLCETGETNPSPQCGDVNDDCQVDLADLIHVLQIVTCNEATGRAAGDCNGDNQVGIIEAIATLEELSK